MVAVGAFIELNKSGKILILRRSKHIDYLPNAWEIPYGRLKQFEEPIGGLKREVKEETGMDFVLINLVTYFHTYRGSKPMAENELVGLVFHVRTQLEIPILSPEHSAFKWVTPEEADKLVVEGDMNEDIKAFLDYKKIQS